MTAQEVRILIQSSSAFVFLCLLIAAFNIEIYLGWVTPKSIAAANSCWICFCGVGPVLYLTMNKNIRRRSLLLLRCTIEGNATKTPKIFVTATAKLPSSANLTIVKSHVSRSWAVTIVASIPHYIYMFITWSSVDTIRNAEFLFWTGVFGRSVLSSLPIKGEHDCNVNYYYGILLNFLPSSTILMLAKVFQIQAGLKIDHYFHYNVIFSSIDVLMSALIYYSMFFANLCLVAAKPSGHQESLEGLEPCTGPPPTGPPPTGSRPDGPPPCRPPGGFGGFKGGHLLAALVALHLLLTLLPSNSKKSIL
uniref:Vomeronasal type-1 receptor n=1 Tax=Ditylenchus dipsaci TaxID=166011 RepID=A0A915E752_9BILA